MFTRDCRLIISTVCVFFPVTENDSNNLLLVHKRLTPYTGYVWLFLLLFFVFLLLFMLFLHNLQVFFISLSFINLFVCF